MRLLLTMLCGCLLLSTVASAADNFSPWSAPARTTEISPREFNPLQAGVRFFQRYISPVDGPRCPMYPTCSAYALEALHKHGPIIGSFATVDRLFHESGPAFHDQPRKIGNRIRFIDRLEQNDFWLTPVPASVATP